MHNWQVGDLAVTINCPESGSNGYIVEIMALKASARGDCIIHVPGVPGPLLNGYWAERFVYLKPLPGDEDDANQVTSWDELIDIYQPGVPVPITVDA